MCSQAMDDTLHFRLSKEDKKTLEEAARLHNIKLNTYVRTRLLQAARRDLEQYKSENVYVLNDKEWNRFIDIMEAPVQITSEMRNALAKYKDYLSE